MNDKRVEAACEAYDSFAMNGDGDPHREAMRRAIAAADTAAWEDYEQMRRDAIEAGLDLWADGCSVHNAIGCGIGTFAALMGKPCEPFEAPKDKP